MSTMDKLPDFINIDSEVNSINHNEELKGKNSP